MSKMPLLAKIGILPTIIKGIKKSKTKMNYFKHYGELMTNNNLTPSMEKVMMVLINRAEYFNGKQFYCYTSWISSQINKTERTVKRAIKQLEALNYISIKKSYNKENRKTTNYYTVNMLPKGELVTHVEESGIMEQYEQEIVVDENITNEININNNNNMITYDNTEIPNELLYPYEQIEKEIMEDKKEYVANHSFTTNKEEIKENVKKWLLDNSKTNKKSIIFYPSIKKEYGYSYKQVFQVVEELKNEGIITYIPEMKNEKIYHYYFIPTTAMVDDDKFEETLGKWFDVCTTHIKLFKQTKQTEMDRRNLLDIVEGYAPKYMINGVTKDDLHDILKMVTQKLLAA